MCFRSLGIASGDAMFVYPRCKRGQVGDSFYNTIVVHHSGNDNNNPTVNEVQKEHMRDRNLIDIFTRSSHDPRADISYHFAIDKDGVIYQGRPIDVLGAHVDKANTGKIGIVMLADLDTQNEGLSTAKKMLEEKLGDGELTDEMIVSLEKLVVFLNNKYGIIFFGVHDDVNCARNCPGDLIRTTIEDLRKKYNFYTPVAATGNK